MSATKDAEATLERALTIQNPYERQIRVTDARNNLYRAQKREFEASIRRRAKLNREKP